VDGLEKIKNRILNDARLEAQKLIEEAEAKVSSIKAEQDIKVQKLKLDLADEAKADAQDHKKRLIAAAQLEMRKDLLKLKRQMLDKAFIEAENSIRRLPVSEYGEAIKSMLLALKVQGETEVIFCKEDKDNFGNGFVDEINAVFKAIGKNMRIKLSAETHAFKGGFILKAKGLEINNTIEALVKLARDEAEPLAARVLFADSLNRKEVL